MRISKACPLTQQPLRPRFSYPIQMAAPVRVIPIRCTRVTCSLHNTIISPTNWEPALRARCATGRILKAVEPSSIESAFCKVCLSFIAYWQTQAGAPVAGTTPINPIVINTTTGTTNAGPYVIDRAVSSHTPLMSKNIH